MDVERISFSRQVPVIIAQNVTLKLSPIGSTTVCKMEKVTPMSSWNQILLVLSVAAAILSLVVQEWTGLTIMPISVSIPWSISLIILSVCLSCYLLNLMLTADSPIDIGFINEWIQERLAGQLGSDSSAKEDKDIEIARKSNSENQKDSKVAQEGSVKCNNATSVDVCESEIPLRRKKLNVTEMTREINAKCIEIWYKNISSDKSFPDEAQDLLSKFLTRLVWKASLIDKIKFTNKLANVLLLHLKEYRRYG